MNLKSILYFTLGLASLLPFALRFFIQWILSERKKESYVTPIFWYLSIVGNIAQLLHYLIQIQYHLYFIRFFPLYFSFRELSLLNKKGKPFSSSRLIKITTILTLSLTFLFMLRVWLEHRRFFWIEHLVMPWDQTHREIALTWHILGFLGASLFMSRVWVQWWQSEKTHESYLSPAFWWLSIIGGSLTLFYALFIRDYVTACGYITGLIPYIRNLMLIQKSKKKIEA